MSSIKLDNNNDGQLTDEEINEATAALEIQLKEEKATTQKRMAWVALISMLVITGFLFLPIVTDTRVKALADLLGLFYIAQAGIVGAYMSVTAWMSSISNNLTNSKYSSFAQFKPKGRED